MGHGAAHDDGGKLVGEYDNLGRARTGHVWVGDRPVAAITYTYVSTNLTPATTTVSYVETDHLGTPRLVTNASRQARWNWVSAPYGDTLANENPAALGVYPYNLRFRWTVLRQRDQPPLQLASGLRINIWQIPAERSDRTIRRPK